jgi:hypothetical protein
MSSSWNGGVSARFSTSSAPGQHLDLAGGQFGFSVPSGRRARGPIRRASTYSLRTCSASANISGRSGIEHHLHQAAAVAQVDEDDAAVVAAAVHPAAKADLFWSMSGLSSSPQ